MKLESGEGYNRKCKNCKIEGEVRDGYLECPKCDKGIRFKPSLAELPDGRYRASVLSAHLELSKVPLTKREVFGHHCKGDKSTGLFQTEENSKAWYKAAQLLELERDTNLIYAHCAWGKPLEEMSHLTEGSYVVTGDIENPKVFETIITRRLEGTEFKNKRKDLRRVRALEKEIGDPH